MQPEKVVWRKRIGKPKSEGDCVRVHLLVHVCTSSVKTKSDGDCVYACTCLCTCVRVCVYNKKACTVNKKGVGGLRRGGAVGLELCYTVAEQVCAAGGMFGVCGGLRHPLLLVASQLR